MGFPHDLRLEFELFVLKWVLCLFNVPSTLFFLLLLEFSKEPKDFFTSFLQIFVNFSLSMASRCSSSSRSSGSAALVPSMTMFSRPIGGNLSKLGRRMPSRRLLAGCISCYARLN